VILLRPLRLDDLDALLPLQREGSVAALSHVFPQDEHPFPTEEVRRRWVAELADARTACLAAVRSGELVGFAATRADELFHFGTAVSTWGSGVAGVVHDEVVGRLREQGHRRVWLRVFDENHRAIRFYQRRGWRRTDEVSWSLFPPHPVLRRFELDLV
jgi:putative acetyltransferase